MGGGRHGCSPPAGERMGERMGVAVAFLDSVMSQDRAVDLVRRAVGPIAVLAYTALRLLIFAGVWALLSLVTPLRGLWSVTLAILISGAISIFALNRQRDEVSVGVSGFFSRLNARIDASTRAEDDDSDEAQPGSQR